MFWSASQRGRLRSPCIHSACRNAQPGLATPAPGSISNLLSPKMLYAGLVFPRGRWWPTEVSSLIPPRKVFPKSSASETPAKPLVSPRLTVHGDIGVGFKNASGNTRLLTCQRGAGGWRGSRCGPFGGPHPPLPPIPTHGSTIFLRNPLCLFPAPFSSVCCFSLSNLRFKAVREGACLVSSVKHQALRWRYHHHRPHGYPSDSPWTLLRATDGKGIASAALLFTLKWLIHLPHGCTPGGESSRFWVAVKYLWGEIKVATGGGGGGSRGVQYKCTSSIIHTKFGYDF